MELSRLKTHRQAAPEALSHRLRVRRPHLDRCRFLERHRCCAPGQKNSQDSGKQPSHDASSPAAGDRMLQNEGTTSTDDR